MTPCPPATERPRHTEDQYGRYHLPCCILHQGQGDMSRIGYMGSRYDSEFVNPQK